MKFTHFLAAALAIGLAVPGQAQMFGGADPLSTFDNADANKDGVVSRAEYADARNARFAQLDRNHDGAIAKDDFGRLAKFRPQVADRLAALIARADTDHDGLVSKAEWAAAPIPVFDRIDANGDGKVDKTELAKGREMLAAIKAEKGGAD
jgi:hypothetical protein